MARESNISAAAAALGRIGGRAGRGEVKRASGALGGARRAMCSCGHTLARHDSGCADCACSGFTSQAHARRAEAQAAVAAGRSPAEVAAALGISRQRVAQLLHPEKARARAMAGELPRPDRCEHCGAVGSVEAHHGDYAEPLEVEWLCRECHDLARTGQSPEPVPGCIVPVEVPALRCTCQRCAHVWLVLEGEPPRSCPRCKAKRWQLAPRWARPDRRRQA